MTITEIFEEVRALIGEPQFDTVAEPYLYKDGELLRKLRSAVRQLSAKGVLWGESSDLEDLVIDATEATPVFEEDPTTLQGVLLSLFVAVELLRGDLIKKLNAGEMGVYFRSGFDIIDTKKAGEDFRFAASIMQRELDVMLLRTLTSQLEGGDSVFGEQTGLGA